MSDEAARGLAPLPHALGSALFAATGLVVFALIYVVTADFSAEARPFPRLIAVVGMLGAGLAVVQSLRAALEARRAAEPAAADGPRWSDILISYGGPPLYGALLYVTGFWIASTIALVGLLAALGERRPLLVAAITFGTLGAIYLVFEVGFSIRMPGSMLVGAK